MYEFVKNFLLTTLQEAKQRDDDVLGWLIDVMLKIKDKPQYLEAMAQIMSYPADTETLNIFNNMFVLLIKHLREVGQTNPGYEKFSWQKSGPFILKQTLKQEFWWMISDIIGYFSLSEVRDSINFLARIINRLGSTQQDVKPMVLKLLDFMRSQGTAVYKVDPEKGHTIAARMEKDIYKIYQAGWKEGQIEDINNVVEELLKEHKGFDGQVYPSIKSQLPEIFEWSMTGMTGMFRDYQSVESFKQYPSYLKRLLSSLIKPFDMDERSHRGARILV
jgi:hypothetical protein